jgi:hypothetical protein
MSDLNKKDLDNYITGHHGEDQLKGENKFPDVHTFALNSKQIHALAIGAALINCLPNPGAGKLLKILSPVAEVLATSKVRYKVIDA